MYSWHAARVFDVLANETRLAMMMELAQADHAAVSVDELADLLDLDARVVLGQAERLCEAGFIVLRRIDQAWEIQLDQDKMLDFISFVQRTFTPRAERVRAPSRRAADRPAHRPLSARLAATNARLKHARTDQGDAHGSLTAAELTGADQSRTAQTHADMAHADATVLDGIEAAALGHAYGNALPRPGGI
ncbi:MAG: hypothetical protein AAFO79_03270, partial [Pseudomonadota bacterium]